MILIASLSSVCVCVCVPGCHYYYLPWGNVKPVVVLSSEWEDINPRIEALNMLLAVVERLVGVDARLVVLLNLLDTDRVCVCLCVCVQEENLQRVQLEVKAGSDLEEVELRVVELLDQVIADCR